MIKELSRILPERLPLAQARELAEEMERDILLGAKGAISDATRHLAQRPGKGARAYLLLCSSADENMEAPRDAVYAACALELFHLATLVHDDVIDDADTRRGIQSIQSRHGKKSAVIIGDYILCLSMGTLSKILDGRSPEEALPFRSCIQSLMGVCLGEFSQWLNSGNLSLDAFEYLRIVSGKTAELFRVAAMAGAALGGASPREARKAGWVGFDIGIVFQIIDDCKDYEQTEQTARKPVKKDLPQGVVTMPLIMAMAKQPSLALAASAAIKGERDSQEVARLVGEAGGVAQAKALAMRFAQKAERILETLEASHQRQALSEILSRALQAAEKFG
ncbi:MAG: polyprenyl synthetase family protein [Clostridiales bacterium]|jgi:heptaprenyl diphosphate synthase|nr:polyprenyl synthetase family protein [Clostridiales bacterium]MDR2749618.1 polyprenyl synthetase family protein [Clostridiales bacterium]